MDQTVVKFKHCGKYIYSFSKANVASSQHNVCPTETSVCPAETRVCPVCRNPLLFGLLDAPVALPSPFTNGHETQCSFLLGANEGPWCLSEWRETELHVGISDSKGLVYNYTLSGVKRDEHGWEQCVSIRLVPPFREDLIQLWDKELNLFSSFPAWSPERFHEETEFGSCCYGFALTFINFMRRLDSKASISRNEFTSNYVLPRVKHTSMYIRVYEEILQHEECPECGTSFSGRRLDEAPISIPNPFINGHKTPCAFLIAPADDNTLREYNGGSDLHTGITNTNGVVYNYTRSGVRNDTEGWEHCISITLVQPDMYNLINQWDQYLEKFSTAQMWNPLWQSFNEENHNCYSYTLMFINCLLAMQSKRALSKEEFTQTFILPRVKRASKYSILCQEISQNHFYIVESAKKNSQEKKERQRDI